MRSRRPCWPVRTAVAWLATREKKWHYSSLSQENGKLRRYRRSSSLQVEAWSSAEKNFLGDSAACWRLRRCAEPGSRCGYPLQRYHLHDELHRLRQRPGRPLEVPDQGLDADPRRLLSTRHRGRRHGTVP